MEKKFELKQLLTATNILMAVLVIFYLFDRYLPLPHGYTGYTAWDKNGPAALNYIFGSCGGLLTNSMAMGGSLAGGTAFYRHFTQMFLHDGLFHLIVNLVGLFFVGNYVEKRFGWWLTPILFVLIAFIESFITDPLYAAMFPKKAAEAANQVSLGASGGVFGLIGAGLAAIFFDIKSFRKIGKPTIAVSAIYGIVPTYIIDLGWTTVCHNVAFILGLALGAVIILPFFLLKKGKFSKDNRSDENAQGDPNN